MKKFLLDTLERAIKTAAQTAIATIGTTATIGAVDWRLVASTVAVAAILSILTSIASRPVGDADSASLVSKKEE